MSSINTILIATDLSDRAARAENRAAMLGAAFRSATVELLNVKEASLPDTLARITNSTSESAQARLVEQTQRELQARAAELADNHGIQCACAVRFGRPASEIVSRANELGADLTVVGAHGGNFLTDLFIGNTVDKLTHLCRQPLLVVKNEARQAYRRVLVPVDFSEDSKHAARVALAIAPDADITILHAFEVLFEGQMQYANVPREQINNYRTQAREEARLAVNQFIDELGAGDRHITRELKFDLPGPAVREYAMAVKPDLIVMGKHGRSRFEEFIIGSVTRATLDQTDSDVLIVSPASAA